VETPGVVVRPGEHVAARAQRAKQVEVARGVVVRVAQERRVAVYTAVHADDQRKAGVAGGVDFRRLGVRW